MNYFFNLKKVSKHFFPLDVALLAKNAFSDFCIFQMHTGFFAGFFFQIIICDRF